MQMTEDYEDRPRQAYMRLVADDDAPVRPAPGPAVDYADQDPDEPLETLDARDQTEVDWIEEVQEEARRRVAGSWVLACIIEAVCVCWNLGRTAVALVSPSTYRGTANPVVRSAAEQDTVDVIAEERAVERTRSAAQTAKDIRCIARQVARGNKVDPEVLRYRVSAEQVNWLMALTTAEADALGNADLKDIDLHATSTCAMIPGVRTPAQFESGIAAVIAATAPRQPPRLNAEIYRELQDCRRRGPSIGAA